MRIMCAIIIVLDTLGVSFFQIHLGALDLSNTRLGFLLTVLAVIYDLAVHKKWKVSWRNSQSRRSFLFMITWFAYGVLNIIFVRDYYGWLTNCLMLCQACFTVLLFMMELKSPKDIMWMLNVFLGVGVFHNIIGWYEYFTGNYSFVSKDVAYAFARFRNPTSAFGNCNDFATYLLFVLIGAFVLAAYEKIKYRKFLGWGLCISSATLILLTGSRAVILSLFIVAALMMFYYLRLSLSKKKLSIFFLGCLICICILVWLERKLLLVASVSSRFADSGNVSSNSERLRLLKNGIFFLTKSFMLGIGAGNADYWLTYGAKYAVTVHKLHNWFMEILACYGIPIFTWYLSTYVRVLRWQHRLLKTRNRGEAVWSCAMFFIAGWVGYIFASISSGSNFLHAWIWVIWAITLAFFNINDSDGRMQRGKIPQITGGI